ncbi:capsule biosynthesis protein [Acuticoccus mangrovi]|uniref:Capsular biosynthesis protein n=1 Tax=Acuticoccus mangrovi TaxID=2796142 RepID=A0A934MMM1_9HYPH|nr:capsular biosynthesis protein [Acuticoccus mangrovi]MBJ3777389.1 capsular biosynthesis protein [Acuticoccus mangrovi]
MSGPLRRHVLLLQGPPSSFFRVLERAFRDRDIQVTRVLLHAGDWLRSGGKGVPYRGRLDGFDAFLDRLVGTLKITDILYFADRTPYHRVAQRVANRRSITPYAVENGYLRPDWLTLEPGGMGAFSRFPAERAAIEALAEGAPPIDDTVVYRHSFATEAYHDVSYTLTRLAGSLRYPHYERDRPNHPILEYVSWLPQLIRRQVARTRAPMQMRRITQESKPFFLFPMQLQEDYQIRHNSRYTDLRELVEEIFSSFARAAPPETALLVKIHPLDNGLQNWQRVLKRAKHRHGLTGRIRMLSAGSLPEMLANCEGVALVNSTVGLYSLRAGRPTKALGAAIYDLPGLTDPQPLDDFWRTPHPPDMAFVDAFVRALARATQLKGSFYDPAGMKVGATEIVRRVAAGFGASDMFVTPPPRLGRARAMGVPMELTDADMQKRVEDMARLW